MKTINFTLLAGTLGIVAILLLGAAPPSPVSISGSQVWTNNGGLIYPKISGVISNSAGYAAPFFVYDPGNNPALHIVGQSLGGIDGKISTSPAGFNLDHDTSISGNVTIAQNLTVSHETRLVNPPSVDFAASWTPIVNTTNYAADFDVGVTTVTPANNVFFLYSTNFSNVGGKDILFKLKGSASNFIVQFGPDMTNFYGTYSSNNYVLGNSNGPHLVAIHIDGSHGTETVAIIPPNK